MNDYYFYYCKPQRCKHFIKSSPNKECREDQEARKGELVPLSQLPALAGGALRVLLGIQRRGAMPLAQGQFVRETLLACSLDPAGPKTLLLDRFATGSIRNLAAKKGCSHP